MLSKSKTGGNPGNMEGDGENSSSQLGADQDASCPALCLLQLLGLKLGPVASKTGYERTEETQSLPENAASIFDAAKLHFFQLPFLDLHYSSLLQWALICT